MVFEYKYKIIYYNYMYDNYIEGGKIKTPRQINRAIRNKVFKPIHKDLIKPANQKFFNPTREALTTMGKELGNFTNEQLLPAAVSLGIPLASSTVGALGEMAGIPPQISGKLTENLLKGYIPKDKQSKNKYVNILGDALNMGFTGETDPMAFMNLEQKFTNALSKDIGLDNPRVVNQPKPIDNYADEDDEYYNHFINQITKGQFMPYRDPILKDEEEDLRDDNDALYGDGNLFNNADSMIITKSPYQQMEGSANGLLGAGIKKKGRKKGKHINIPNYIDNELYVRKKPSYKKFTHSNNVALHQLLDAYEDKRDIERRKKTDKLIEKHNNFLTSMGY